MKINEKSLIHYANSKSSSDKEGYLLKKGEVNKSFQRRWFVLKGNLLFYYDKKHDKEPVGVVVLEGCTIELAAAHHINNGASGTTNNGASGAAMSTESFTFEIVFPRSGARTYVLSAASQEEMESWMKALTCASYDYLKMMVTELQRQLEEANNNQKNHHNNQSWENSQLNTHILGSTDFSSPISSPPSSDTPLRKTNLFASSSSDSFSNRNDSGCEVLTSSKDSYESESTYRPPVGRPCRINPFNSLDSDGESASPLSPDEAVKFCSYSDFLQGKILDFTETNTSRPSGKPRNFLQMHEEFGRLYKNIPTSRDLK